MKILTNVKKRIIWSLGESRTKQWGQWVKVVCKKGANVVTHSRHYLSERPWDWHCTGDGATRMHGLLGGGVIKIYFGYEQDGCPAENFDFHSIATPQKNKICPPPIFIPNVLFYPLGGFSQKSGVRVCEALKTLFPHPCGLSQDSISVFHFSRP